MNERDFNETSPSEARQAKQAKHQRVLEWCKQNGEDPEDEGTWDIFNETDSFWKDMDKDNLAGWTDNITKQ